VAAPSVAAAQPIGPRQPIGPARPAAPPSPARAAAPGQPIGIIDLGRGTDEERAARRAELERGIAGADGFRPVGDESLGRALAGEGSAIDPADGRAALAAAQAAFGELDCRRARGEADRAVLGLAGAQASGAAVAGELRRAHTIRLVCADQGADRGAAQSAAAALRRLAAGDPPPGVSDAVWARYPAIDAATGVQIGRVAITTRPAGAAIWIDHAARGRAPLTVSLPEGEHLIAAALPSGGSVARRVTVAPSWTPTALALELRAGGGSRWRAIAGQVQAWRRGVPRPTAATVGELMARAGLERAVLIDPRDKLEVWIRAPGERTARHLGNATSAAEAAALHASVARGPGIDPNVPLLRETRRERGAERSHQEWWVYAAIVGAVAVGAGIVLAQDLGSDRQRIEIAFP